MVWLGPQPTATQDGSSNTPRVAKVYCGGTFSGNILLYDAPAPSGAPDQVDRRGRSRGPKRGGYGVTLYATSSTRDTAFPRIRLSIAQTILFWTAIHGYSLSWDYFTSTVEGFGFLPTGVRNDVEGPIRTIADALNNLAGAQEGDDYDQRVQNSWNRNRTDLLVQIPAVTDGNRAEFKRLAGAMMDLFENLDPTINYPHSKAEVLESDDLMMQLYRWILFLLGVRSEYVMEFLFGTVVGHLGFTAHSLSRACYHIDKRGKSPRLPATGIPIPTPTGGGTPLLPTFTGITLMGRK